MEQDRKSGPSSGRVPDGGDVPPPEQGSPQREQDKKDHGAAEERVEKGEDKDPNPLAPPVNTQGGS